MFQLMDEKIITIFAHKVSLYGSMVLFQAPALWRLLFELLYFLEHGVIDEIVIKACTELTVGMYHYSYKMNYYSKTCVKRPLSKRQKIGFQDQLLLEAGQKYYCRMLQWEHSAIL